MVGGMVKATIPHMLQSSHDAVLDSEKKSAAMRAAKTRRASAPGTKPPAMTAPRWSRSGPASHNDFDAFSASVLY